MTANPWEPRRFAQPRFATIADVVARLCDEPDWPSVARLDELLRPELASVDMHLVEAAKTKAALLPDGTIDPSSLYEVIIVERREIPTRPNNAHDLLNAVVWAAFPLTKLALTVTLADVQRARARGRTQLPSTRSREHDRLALVDEGAVVCVRGSRTSSTWIFGHAIYEHAYAGQLAVRGTPIDLDVPGIEDLDHGAARAAIDRRLASVDLAAAVRPGPGIPLD
jgi:hypothetical protein